MTLIRRLFSVDAQLEAGTWSQTKHVVWPGMSQQQVPMIWEVWNFNTLFGTNMNKTCQ